MMRKPLGAASCRKDWSGAGLVRGVAPLTVGDELRRDMKDSCSIRTLHWTGTTTDVFVVHGPLI